jgi:hypothetical protein
MRYYRKWVDHPQKLLDADLKIGWHEVKQEYVLDCLLPNYPKWSGAELLEHLSEGDMLRSVSAFYIAVH